MRVNITYLFLLIFCWSIISCNKKEFLNEGPNSNIFVPTTLEEFQELLDNEVVLNVTPVLGELSADNYYILSSYWQLLGNKEHNAYIWAADIYNKDGNISDWNAPYEQVLYANVVLDGLKKVTQTASNQQQWNSLRGAALFIRAYAFYNLVQVFALPYKAETASADLGIPLKLTPNVDEVIKRSSIEQTYAQILNDVQEAKDLLPEKVSSILNRPNKPAAYALLARIYLSMREYNNANLYAGNCLQLFSGLIDYNTKDITAPRPFERANVETMYQSKFVETNVAKASRDCMVDSTLYSQYAVNDLRRSLFFTMSAAGNINFKGSYNSSAFGFTGMATDEMYLIRAECLARAGNKDAAMADLNTLLRKRWKTGTFTDLTAADADKALNIILTERRKEMPMRGVRWTDIRRLNLENANITPTRILNNQPYTLPANSPKYALPIPPDAILMGHYIQNDRE